MDTNDQKQGVLSQIDKLGAWSQKPGLLHVIVDTPKGSANKYQLDEDLGVFKLGGVLTAGHSFPFDFGFIPGTLGGDGDPLDVLILMDQPAFVGCLVECRLIGGCECYQTEDGQAEERNDRLLAVAEKSVIFGDIANIDDVFPKLIDQIEHFFASYNEAKGKAFRVAGRYGPDEAQKIISSSLHKYQ